MNIDSNFFLTFIRNIAGPINDFLKNNSSTIKEYFFRNEYAVLFFSVLIAICIIKNDFLFILLCLMFYVLLYILLWKYIA